MWSCTLEHTGSRQSERLSNKKQLIRPSQQAYFVLHACVLALCGMAAA